jgi:hypothetical protein
MNSAMVAASALEIAGVGVGRTGVVAARAVGEVLGVGVGVGVERGVGVGVGVAVGLATWVRVEKGLGLNSAFAAVIVGPRMSRRASAVAPAQPGKGVGAICPRAEILAVMARGACTNHAALAGLWTQ